MSVIHIKVMDGQQKRLLEYMIYHDLRKDKVINFLDDLEKLLKKYFEQEKRK